MKPFQSTILILILFNSIGLKGQNMGDTINKKNTQWTISANVYSLPYLFTEEVPPLEIQRHFFTGFILERDFKFINARAGFEYFNINISNEDPGCCDIPSTEGYNKQSLYKIGVEKGMVFNKHFRPYLATELAGIIMQSKVTYSGGFSPQQYTIKVNTKSIGLLQTFGFQLLLNKTFSLSIESRVALVHYKSDNNYYNFNQNASSAQTNTGFIYALNPISGLMLNLHF
jgi:hypothetical protein